jgi:hypothetical protein
MEEGKYKEARYFIRFFQTDGKGELRLDDGTLLTANDLFPLLKEEFRLYYTSRCTDQQNIDVYIEDRWGQVVQKHFLLRMKALKKERTITTEKTMDNSNWEELDAALMGRDNRLFSLYSTLADWRKTDVVSIAAVSAHSENLDYVPDYALTPDICCAALTAKDADLYILSKIPFVEVQKEAIKKFSDEANPAFVLYNFTGISDAEMAKNAVKADAYCLQFVPEKLLTAELCKMALHSPNADNKVLGLIPEQFRTPDIVKTANEKFGNPILQKETPPPKKKSLSV